jgi:transcriptional regulator with XRE-family HTH domain
MRKGIFDMEARDFISDLIASGMTQSQIEARTGIRQATISKVARGDVKDVLSANYRKLQALHAEVCPGDAPAAEPVFDRRRSERRTPHDQVVEG